MYLQRGGSASYDIRLAPDSTGHVKALDILSLISPNANIATSILQNIAANLHVPGLDLSSAINESLLLKDAGFILRQHQPNFVTVSLDDFYGTVSTSEALKLALDLLPFPTRLNIPQNLPDFSLMMQNVTGTVHKVSMIEKSTMIV